LWSEPETVPTQGSLYRSAAMPDGSRVGWVTSTDTYSATLTLRSPEGVWSTVTLMDRNNSGPAGMGFGADGKLMLLFPIDLAPDGQFLYAWYEEP
ncbi:MAG TPA: hypothetical protein VJ570_01425, partial [Holophagaceae bacterium]|nr:hypothetical protein [Holophagaceae bacterium]